MVIAPVQGCLTAARVVKLQKAPGVEPLASRAMTRQ
jgi:hypothetical protein